MTETAAKTPDITLALQSLAHATVPPRLEPELQAIVNLLLGARPDGMERLLVQPALARLRVLLDVVGGRSLRGAYEALRGVVSPEPAQVVTPAELREVYAEARATEVSK